MDRHQIITAVQDHQNGGPPPTSFYNGREVPVDPNSGAVIERLFDPYELGGELSAAGFSTRVVGYWGGASGKPVIRLANRVLGSASRLTIYTAPSFMIAARKM
jgi:hypothetical protein